jgi:hypothetical protein
MFFTPAVTATPKVKGMIECAKITKNNAHTTLPADKPIPAVKLMPADLPFSPLIKQKISEKSKKSVTNNRLSHLYIYRQLCLKASLTSKHAALILLIIKDAAVHTKK